MTHRTCSTNPGPNSWQNSQHEPRTLQKHQATIVYYIIPVLMVLQGLGLIGVYTLAPSLCFVQFGSISTFDRQGLLFHCLRDVFANIIHDWALRLTVLGYILVSTRTTRFEYFMYMHMYTFIHTYIHTSSVGVCVYIYIYVCVQLYVWMYVCMHICMYVHSR